MVRHDGKARAKEAVLIAAALVQVTGVHVVVPTP